MYRSYALSLGALAMALVAFRGAMNGDLALETVKKALMALIAYSILGMAAGAIMDYLIRQMLKIDTVAASLGSGTDIKNARLKIVMLRLDHAERELSHSKQK